MQGNLLFDVLALFPITQTLVNIDYMRPLNIMILMKVVTAKKIIQ